MSVRQDERLAPAAPGVPMTEVDCARCGATVLARKSSWEQTSIQWSARAMAVCSTPPADGHSTCPALRESIARAAAEGRLPVLDEVAPSYGAEVADRPAHDH
ncbi:ferredoxin [Spirillospora sp. NPDC029432]|uniref:ferredoxin n=1 Tax=Spirillospora sp. NPDC029432 TaxID=3154599 RepID=UPI0034569CCF